MVPEVRECLPASSSVVPKRLPSRSLPVCREQERMAKAEQARLETERILREQQVGFTSAEGCA